MATREGAGPGWGWFGKGRGQRKRPWVSDKERGLGLEWEGVWPNGGAWCLGKGRGLGGKFR